MIQMTKAEKKALKDALILLRNFAIGGAIIVAYLSIIIRLFEANPMYASGLFGLTVFCLLVYSYYKDRVRHHKGEPPQDDHPCY